METLLNYLMVQIKKERTETMLKNRKENARND